MLTPRWMGDSHRPICSPRSGAAKAVASAGVQTRRGAVRLVVLGVSVVVLGGACSSSDNAKAPVSSTPTASVRTTTTLAASGPVVRTGQQRLPPLYAQGVARVPGRLDLLRHELALED